MVVEHELSTEQAARLLEVSAPTVRELISTGQLDARRVDWGSRFRWRVTKRSVDDYLSSHGAGQGSIARLARKVDALEAAIVQLGNERPARDQDTDATAAERDDLRARVAALEDSLMRAREVAELQAAADQARSEMVTLLADAIRAADRADELRRGAIGQLTEALAGYERPLHAGQVL